MNTSLFLKIVLVKAKVFATFRGVIACARASQIFQPCCGYLNISCKLELDSVVTKCRSSYRQGLIIKMLRDSNFANYFFFYCW